MPNASATQNIAVLISQGVAAGSEYGASATQNIAVLASNSTARTEYNAHGVISFRVAFGVIGSASVLSPNVLTQGLLQSQNFGFQAVLQGPPLGIEVPLNSIGLNTGVQPSGSVVSMVIPSHYFPHIVMGIKSTQGGALNIQRYIDVAGTIAQGAVLTVALSANTAALIDDVDGKGFGSFTITVTNTGASVATLSAMVLLLLAK